MATNQFALGTLSITPGARDALSQDEVFNAMRRHVSGDWGETDDHDTKANNRAVVEGTRVFSIYVSPRNVRFWIITEADRSYTTVLLPSEY